MTRIAAALLTTVLMAIPYGSSADHQTFNEQGRILIGHSGTASSGDSVGDRFRPCSGQTIDGIDSVWFALEGFEGHTATLTMDVTLDADAYFADSACHFNRGSLKARGLGLAETGTIQADTFWVQVAGFQGTGTFRLVVD